MLDKKMEKIPFGLLCLILILFMPFRAGAGTYDLYGNGDSVIGQLRTVTAEYKDTLLDVARAYGFGYQDIKLLNPSVDTWLPGEGHLVELPSQFVLPSSPRQGIVLNIPEMRLYYYPPAVEGKLRKVVTYPLGVGRQGWSTPYIKTRIIEKKVNPKWYPPESIRKEHEEANDPLPKIVEAGPDNPLGDYALRLGMPDYLIHGTNKPFGIGMRVSHGCIRLYPEDIEALFQEVKVKTPVQIVNQPYKVGVQDGIIYLEAHPYLHEDAEEFENNLTSIVKLIIDITSERNYEVDWAAAYDVINQPRGIPVAIGMYLTEQVQVSTEETVNGTGVKSPNALELRIDTELSE
jgi:L,D-transpeptidase ErfK/SrfK